MAESKLVDTSLVIVADTGSSLTIACGDLTQRYIITSAADLVLTGDCDIEVSDTPLIDQYVIFDYLGTIAGDGHTITLLGNAIPSSLYNVNFVGIFRYNGTTWDGWVIPDAKGSGFITAAMIQEATITNNQLANLTAGYIKVGNGSNRPADVNFSGDAQIPIGDGTTLNSVAITGVIALTNGGVASFAAGAIVNADINAGADIVVTKLETLSDGTFLMGNSGNKKQSISGSLSVAADGTAALAGNAAVETFVIPVSFEAGSQCGNKFFPGFAGTIVSIVAYVTKAIAGTDDATITVQIGGTGVTGGVVTLPASSALDASESASPTALNVFDNDDVISLVTLKTTAGGTALVTVQCSRV